MKQALKKAPAQKITGHFDGIESGLAIGWAYDPMRPNERLLVEILCEGEIVALGNADEFREDLAPAGVGDGKHLFKLPISYELRDGKVHSLIAREATTGSPLLGGAASFGPEERTFDFDLINRKQGLNLLQQILEVPIYPPYNKSSQQFERLYRIGALAQETGRLEDARYTWQALGKALGENSLFYCKLGETYLLEGNASKALEFYQAAAINIFPTTQYPYIGMSNALSALGRLAEAESVLKNALDAFPRSPVIQKRLNELGKPLLSHRVSTLISNNKKEEAIALLKSISLNEADDDIAPALLADLLIPPLEASDSQLPPLQLLNELQKAQVVLEIVITHAEELLSSRAKSRQPLRETC